MPCVFPRESALFSKLMSPEPYVPRINVVSRARPEDCPCERVVEVAQRLLYRVRKETVVCEPRDWTDRKRIRHQQNDHHHGRPERHAGFGVVSHEYAFPNCLRSCGRCTQSTWHTMRAHFGPAQVRTSQST